MAAAIFFIPGIPQFFPEIAGKVGDLPGIRMAVKTAEPAIGNHLKFFFFIYIVGGYSGFYIFPRWVKMSCLHQNSVPDAGVSTILMPEDIFPVFI
jgi:hypothetical protein